MRDKNGRLIKPRDTVRIKTGWFSTKKFTVVMTHKFGMLPLDAEEKISYFLDGLLPVGVATWGKGKGIFAKPPHKFEVI